MLDETYGNLTSTDKETFQRVCRRLLSETFIVRDMDDASRRQFAFAFRNFEAISDLLALVGYTLWVDRESGVAMLREIPTTDGGRELHTGHRKFTKNETILLLTLRLIYGEKISSGVLAKNVVVTIHDIMFALEKFGCKSVLDNPSKAEKLLRTLAQYNLIKVIGTIGTAECRICLYPSLMFAQSVDEMSRWLESTNKRIFGDSADDGQTAIEDVIMTQNEPIEGEVSEDSENE